MASLHIYNLSVPYLRDGAGWKMTPAEYVAQHRSARGKSPEWVEREAARVVASLCKTWTRLGVVKPVTTPSGGQGWVFVGPDDLTGPGWTRRVEQRPTGTYLWVTRKDGRGVVFDITTTPRVVGISTAEGHPPREMDWAWFGTVPPWEPRVGLGVFAV